jgi:anti-sigma regulatory factor (Ser/Thr protein kinase)
MSCQAVPANLAALLGFIEEACAEAKLEEEVEFAMRLAGEEVCCNIVNHAYEGMEPGPVSLEFRTEDDRAILVIEDRAPLFAPSDAPPPDLSSDWENRRVGGLGWHLIGQVMDEVRHEPVEGGGNRLTLAKRRAPAAQAVREGNQ